MEIVPVHKRVLAKWDGLVVSVVKVVSVQLFQVNLLRFHLAICTTPCVNGNCTSPQTCTCQSGWTGSLCNQRESLFL